LDAEALVSWLKSVAVQGKAGLLKQEMEETMTQVQQAISSPAATRQISGGVGFSGYGLSGGNSLNTIPWLDWVPVVIGVLVWGIGIIRIVRKPSMAGDSHIIS
jgi:hypothetical protein